MDNKLICLPKPFIKNRPNAAKAVEPLPDKPTPPTAEVPMVNNIVSLSDVPLPPPGDDELADDDENMIVNSESPSSVADATPVPDTGEESAHEINPHVCRST